MSLTPLRVASFVAETREDEINWLNHRLKEQYGLVLKKFAEITDPLFFVHVTRSAEMKSEIPGDYIVSTKVRSGGEEA